MLTLPISHVWLGPVNTTDATMLSIYQKTFSCLNFKNNHVKKTLKIAVMKYHRPYRSLLSTCGLFIFSQDWADPSNFYNLTTRADKWTIQATHSVNISNSTANKKYKLPISGDKNSLMKNALIIIINSQETGWKPWIDMILNVII